MKYTIIMLVSCIPLVVLTIWSVVEAVQTPDRPQDRGRAGRGTQVAELVKTATPLAQDSKQRADKSMPLVHQLAEANLWDPQPVNMTPVAVEELIPVVAAVRQLLQANQLVDAFAPVAERLAKIAEAPADTAQQRKKNADDARQEIRTFLRNYRGASDSTVGDPIKGAAALFELLASRADDLAGQTESIDLSMRITDALRDARQLLASKKFTECLAMLAADPLRQAADEATKRELAMLRLQAQYGIDRQALEQRRATGPADRTLLARATDFLAQYPSAPTPADEPGYDEIRRFRAKLEIDIRTADLKNVRDFDALIAESAEIVKLPGVTAQNKAAIRSAVAEWLLARGFPRLQPPADLLDKREGWTKKGDRLLGYFDLPDGVEQWRYWKDKQGYDNKNPPVGILQIRRDSFSEPPDIPRYVQWATAYNKYTADLVDRPSTKPEWQNFAAWCDRTEKDLEAYRSRQGIGVQNEPDRSCAGWSFRSQAALAQRIIDHWNEFQQVMGQ